MILYVHGFGSSAQGYKAKLFEKHYKKLGISFFAPNLSYIPNLAIETLSWLCENFQDVKLIGSSLGGYYSLYLAKKYNLKAVVINPAVYAYERLEEAVDKNVPSFYDESSFLWTRNHLESLKKYDTKEVDESILFLLQTGDKLLDYKDSLKKYKKPNVLIEEGGSHAFENIESKLELIDDFLLH
jgi:hypothetical protein